MATSPIGPNPNPAQSPTATTSAGNIPGADKATFLKLLVTQIRNQDPLNPQDSTQFVTQLAQFSELEQMTEVNSTLQAIREHLGIPPSSDNTAKP
ncbi:MAG: hypothetical protein HYX25_00820 [Candidatus Solibacter usitatus]|nr:hypothetical protein [Candidatus Solibacter usitatus]